MGAPSDRPVKPPDPQKEGVDHSKETKEAKGANDQLHKAVGTPDEQRLSLEAERKRVRESLAKTQEFPPSDELMAMLKRADQKAGVQSQPEGKTPARGDSQPAAVQPGPDGAPGKRAEATPKAGNGDQSAVRHEAKAAVPGDAHKEVKEVKEVQAPKALSQDDKTRLDTASKAIFDATKYDSYVRGADGQAVLSLLRDNTKTEAEREYLRNQMHDGKSMDDVLKKTLSKSEYERAQNILETPLANGQKRKADDVGDVAANLKELNQWTGSRSSEQIQKDITEMVASKTPAELKQLDTEYQKRYGKTFSEAVTEDPNMSKSAKQVVDIYMHSTRDAQGRLSSDDVQKLAGVALKNGDAAALGSAFKGASQEARERFFAEGGDKKLKDLMQDDPQAQRRRWDGNEYLHAKELVKNGELGVATQIRDNSGIASNTDKAIEATLREMKPEERKLYQQGKELANTAQPDENSAAYKYYKNVHAAIQDATHFDAKRAALEDKVEHPGGSIISKIADKHAGSIYNDGPEKIQETVAKGLSKQDFELYKTDQSHRDEVNKFLKNTMKLSDQDVSKVTGSLDKAKDYEEYKKNAQAGDKSQPVPIGRQVAEHGEGVWDHKQEFLRDFLKETPEKRQELLKSSLGDKIRAPLDEQQRQVLENLTKPGSPNPADMVRAHVVGLGVSKEDLADRLSKLTPEQKEHLKTDYAKEYKTDALSDLAGSKTGIERDKWTDLLKRPAETTEQAMADTRKQYIESRGFERGLVDSWDGTNQQYRDRYHTDRENFVQAKSRGEITPSSEKEHVQKLNEEHKKLFEDRERVVESRKEAATAVVTGAATVATLGSGLVAGVGMKSVMVGGALLKAGTMEAVVGSDGDTSMAGRSSNLLTGAVEAGLMKFAPGAGHPEMSLGKKMLENTAVAAISTVPTVAVDTVRNWDANKSRSENTKEGLERGLINVATASATAVGFTMAHAAGGAVLDRVAKLRGEVPAVHTNVPVPAQSLEHGTVGSGAPAVLDKARVAPGRQVEQHALHGVPGETPPAPIQRGAPSETPQVRERPAVKPPEPGTQSLESHPSARETVAGVAAGRSVPAAGDPGIAPGKTVTYKGDGQNYLVAQRIGDNEIVLARTGPPTDLPRSFPITQQELHGYNQVTIDGKPHAVNRGQVFEVRNTAEGGLELQRKPDLRYTDRSSIRPQALESPVVAGRAVAEPARVETAPVKSGTQVEHRGETGVTRGSVPETGEHIFKRANVPENESLKPARSVSPGDLPDPNQPNQPSKYRQVQVNEVGADGKTVKNTYYYDPSQAPDQMGRRDVFNLSKNGKQLHEVQELKLIPGKDMVPVSSEVPQTNVVRRSEGPAVREVAASEPVAPARERIKPEVPEARGATPADGGLDRANLASKQKQFAEEHKLIDGYIKALKSSDPAIRKQLEDQLTEKGLGKLIVKENYSAKNIERLKVERDHRALKSFIAGDNLGALERGEPLPINKSDKADEAAALARRLDRQKQRELRSAVVEGVEHLASNKVEGLAVKRLTDPKEVPGLRRNEEVLYQGQKAKVAGFADGTGEPVIRRESVPTNEPINVERVKPGMLPDPDRPNESTKYSPLRLREKGPDGTITNNTYYRDGQGRVFDLKTHPDGSQQLNQVRELKIATKPDDIKVPVRETAGLPGTPHEAVHPVLNREAAVGSSDHDSLDAAQKRLRAGTLDVQSNLSGTEGSAGLQIKNGEIVHADGSREKVVFHVIEQPGVEFNDTSPITDRLRKEAAAYKLNPMLGLDNGFPPTVPIATDQVITHNGRPSSGWSGWVQKLEGDQFDHGIRKLAKQRYGSSSSEQVSRLLKEEPELRKTVEQAFAERLIYGSGDNHAKNFILVKDGDKLRVRNIDLKSGFSSREVPQWESLPHGQGVNRRLHADFSEAPLSPELRDTIGKFVDKYDSEAGRKELAKVGLKSDEIEGLVSRARWFAEHGKFPKAVTLEELMERHAREARGVN